MSIQPPAAAKIASLPRGPGVYQFTDEAGSVIYVGKARNLRARVRQYFQRSPSDTRFFFHYLRRNAVDVTTITTKSEAEALILENNLIKELHPKFNIRMRDDKDYLCIRVDLRARWPRCELVRRPSNDGARYFGPFHSGSWAKELHGFIARYFPLRTCSDAVLGTRARPCLQHQIGRCCAPCVLPVEKERYDAVVGEVVLLLAGRGDELAGRLREEMARRSAATDYEGAARTRDLLRAVDTMLERHRVVDIARPDTDVLALARSMDRVTVAVLFIRGGRMVGMRAERFPRVVGTDEETLRAFLCQFYGEERRPPREVLLPLALPDRALVVELLARHRGAPVLLRVPARGRGRELVAMARENAAKELAQWESSGEGVRTRLEQVAARLRLPAPPGRIECVDISHTGGSDAVGSIVVMEEGALRRQDYRRLKVQVAAGGDDFAAMREVLARRLARGVAGEAKWKLPDLLLVDGGKGHLKLASSLLAEAGAAGVAVAAIAKDRRREETALARRRVRERIMREDGAPPAQEEAPAKEGRFDTIHIEGHKEGIPVPSSSPLVLLARLRDEAHRFAIAYHRSLRGKRAVSSRFLKVPGVGPATVRKLFGAFASVDEMRAASAADIARLARIPLPAAARIKEHLGDAPTAEGASQ